MARTSVKKLCLACKPEHAQQPVNEFYASKSPMHSDGKLPWCKNCIAKYSLSEDGTIINEKFREVLCQIGKPYYIDILETSYTQYKSQHKSIPDENIKFYGRQIIGLYFKNLNSLPQNQGDSYIDSEKKGFYKGINKAKDISQLSDTGKTQNTDDNPVVEKEVNILWSEQDLKNKSYVLQSVGYDCFNDQNYTEQNTKFLFNTMADYLTDDVLEDPHKMQRVISLVKTTLQLDSVDKLITSELKKQNPDNSLIKSFTDIKDKLERTINSSANENGISAKSSGKGSKGSNALTNIMKEMGENGFEEIKVNLVNIKLSESYKEISADNAKSLFNELNFTTDEFAKMVATQSEEMIAYQDKIMKLEEEIRLLKVENKRLKCKITELGGDE